MDNNLDKLKNRIMDGFLVSIDVDEGWHDLILEIDKNIAEVDPDYFLDQVKEKYGRLRYYFSCSNKATQQQADYLYDLVNDYERKSYSICEKCGKPGKLRSTSEQFGWFKTLCGEHADSEGYPYTVGGEEVCGEWGSNSYL